MRIFGQKWSKGRFLPQCSHILNKFHATSCSLLYCLQNSSCV